MLFDPSVQVSGYTAIECVIAAADHINIPEGRLTMHGIFLKVLGDASRDGVILSYLLSGGRVRKIV